MQTHRRTLSRRSTDREETPASADLATSDDFGEQLKRRARRLAGKGETRKAALALRELTARTDDPTHWVMLGDMLRRARRDDEALAAFREALWRLRKAGAQRRARSVAALVLALDPSDSQAQRVMATASYSAAPTHRAA